MNVHVPAGYFRNLQRPHDIYLIKVNNSCRQIFQYLGSNGDTPTLTFFFRDLFNADFFKGSYDQPARFSHTFWDLIHWQVITYFQMRNYQRWPCKLRSWGGLWVQYRREFVAFFVGCLGKKNIIRPLSQWPTWICFLRITYARGNIKLTHFYFMVLWLSEYGE